jgi:hypothetical protein
VISIGISVIQRSVAVVTLLALTIATAWSQTAVWTKWTLVPDAGLTALAPSLIVDPATGVLDLATVGLDLGVDHSRFANNAWSPVLATGRATFLPPVLLPGEGGSLQLLVTAPDGVVQHSRFQGGAWSAPVATGAVSFLPPAAAFTPGGNLLDLITAGFDGVLRHSRFQGNAWSDAVPRTAVSFLPPTLIANPAGGLELAFVAADRQVFHARYSGNQWSQLRPTGIFTDMAVALAVSADGVVHLAATSALDRSVVHSRFVNNAWTAPAATGIQSRTAPVLVFQPVTASLELLAPGLNRIVQHGRSGGEGWAAPVPLGIATDVRPALAVGTGQTLEAAVVDADGRVQTSRFSGGPAPPAPVSFAKDILRIFTNNGARTCNKNGCHNGSDFAEGLNLDADSAYASIVDVDSSQEFDLKLVKPGDSANSYLYRKVAPGIRITGSRMPRLSPALSSADVALIRRWIDAGAPDN